MDLNNPRIFICQCKATWSNLSERRQECPRCHKRCWDERPLPTTVRFVAELKPQPATDAQRYNEPDRSAYCLPSDPGFTFIDGYPKRIP